MNEVADNGDSYNILYLDFSKAFAKVTHLRFLRRVRVHKIKREVCFWIDLFSVTSASEMLVQFNINKYKVLSTDRGNSQNRCTIALVRRERLRSYCLLQLGFKTAMHRG